MRLKEIKPGMAVHCKNDEEKRILLKEAERLGYVWYMTKEKPTEKEFPLCTIRTIHFHDANASTPLTANYKHIAWSNEDGTVELSDLILPELTAEDAIKINTELCRGSCNECPLYKVDGYRDCDDLCINNTEKAVEILAQWKSEHEKKEQEIEWVYRVFGAENYGEKFFQTEEEAIKRCEELAKSQKTKQYARYERVCRVKAVE